MKNKILRNIIASKVKFLPKPSEVTILNNDELMMILGGTSSLCYTNCPQNTCGQQTCGSNYCGTNACKVQSCGTKSCSSNV